MVLSIFQGNKTLLSACSFTRRGAGTCWQKDICEAAVSKRSQGRLLIVRFLDDVSAYGEAVKQP